ncbi:MAG: hypothetical protein M1825_000839 [Sarcosagium campestre]|nr:MAG: hypothetical protein M1825_000839 [Sarcosagium campestre]
MGFTTGFFGGIALTSSVLYLTLHAHQRNRYRQSLLLQQSSSLLASLVEEGGSSLPGAPETRIRHAGLVEMAKDRWNDELAGAVNRVYNFDWDRLKADTGNAVASAFSRVVD